MFRVAMHAASAKMRYGFERNLCCAPVRPPSNTPLRESLTMDQHAMGLAVARKPRTTIFSFTGLLLTLASGLLWNRLRRHPHAPNQEGSGKHDQALSESAAPCKSTRPTKVAFDVQDGQYRVKLGKAPKPVKVSFVGIPRTR